MQDQGREITWRDYAHGCEQYIETIKKKIEKDGLEDSTFWQDELHRVELLRDRAFAMAEDQEITKAIEAICERVRKKSQREPRS